MWIRVGGCVSVYTDGCVFCVDMGVGESECGSICVCMHVRG